jgi:hypothetical protein
MQPMNMAVETSLKISMLVNGMSWLFREVILGALGTIFYIAFFCFSGIGLLLAPPLLAASIAAAIHQTLAAPLIFLGYVISVIACLLFFIMAWSIKHKIEGTGPLGSELITIMLRILRWWGMLFRSCFISSIGLGAYLWFAPQPIGDVPFSELTLNQVFGNLFAVIIASGCIFWFFKFPIQEHPDWPNDNPYDFWGSLGIFVVFIVPVIVFLISVLI